MKIMKLIYRQYFDEDGYHCDSYYEALQNSRNDKNLMQIVHPQKCRVYENSELNEEDIFTEQEFNYYIFSMKGVPLFGTDNLNDFIDYVPKRKPQLKDISEE